MAILNVSVPEDVILNSELTGTDFKVYCIIRLFLRKRRKVTVKTISKESKMGERTVYRALERLQNLNYIADASSDIKEIVIADKIDKELSVNGAEVNDCIAAFEAMNPSFERLFGNTTQRKAVERLLSKMGKDKLLNGIEFASKVLGQPYAPQITTPVQLEEKLGALVAFYKRSEIAGSKYIFTKI